MLRKPLSIHLHVSELLKMLSHGIEIEFPYETRHKLVELFGAKTILIVVYVIYFEVVVWVNKIHQIVV